MEAGSAGAPQQPGQSPVFSEDAKKLLDGIINTDKQAHFSLVTQHAGTLMCLGMRADNALDFITSYEEGCDVLRGFEGEADLGKFVELETFIWTGENLATDMWIHRKFVRVGWIIECIEVTDDQWRAYVTDHVSRQQQAVINRASQAGLIQ